MSERYAAVVFDLDGTLFDSAPAMQRIAAAYFRELGVEEPSLEETKSYIGHGARTFLRLALADRGLDDEGAFDARFERFHELYGAAPGEDNRAYAGALDTLEALAAAGIALGLCTNKPHRPTLNVLRAYGLERRFASIVDGETLAERKPDPAPLLHTLDALRADRAAALYVGDSEVDAQTAKAAGIDFALFAHGYRSVTIEELAPNYVIERMSEVVAIALGRQKEGAPSKPTVMRTSG